MRGLDRVPPKAELVAVANRLQSNESIEVADLALYTQWARLDPRFAEILVVHLTRTWRSIPYGKFTEALALQPWPQAAEVLLRFAELNANDTHLRSFIEALTRIFPASDSPQLFFIPLRWPNAVVTREELRFNGEIYARAGFIGAQSLLSRAKWPSARTQLSQRARRAIMNELLTNESDVKVADYVRACRGLVTVRQAQRDLVEHARASGYTRRRRYAKRV